MKATDSPQTSFQPLVSILSAVSPSTRTADEASSPAHLWSDASELLQAAHPEKREGGSQVILQPDGKPLVMLA
jgi:hypothetical protein